METAKYFADKRQSVVFEHGKLPVRLCPIFQVSAGKPEILEREINEMGCYRELYHVSEEDMAFKIFGQTISRDRDAIIQLRRETLEIEGSRLFISKNGMPKHLNKKYYWRIESKGNLTIYAPYLWQMIRPFIEQLKKSAFYRPETDQRPRPSKESSDSCQYTHDKSYRKEHQTRTEVPMYSRRRGNE